MLLVDVTFAAEVLDQALHYARGMYRNQERWRLFASLYSFALDAFRRREPFVFWTYFSPPVAQALRQSLRQKPWHLNSSAIPPSGPPQRGHIKFKIEDTSAELSKHVADVVSCIFPSR